MLSRRARRRLLANGLLATVVAALFGAATLADVLGTLRAQATDLLFAARPMRPAASTAIVGIDQRSYQSLLGTYGPLSAWPRSLYAHAVDALAAAGARVVAFAVFFDAPYTGDALCGHPRVRALLLGADLSPVMYDAVGDDQRAVYLPPSEAVKPNA